MATPRRSGANARVLVLALSGCAEPDAGSIAAEPDLERALAGYGAALDPAPTSVAELRWVAPPADCLHVYRLTATYDPPLMYEPDSISTMALGYAPGKPAPAEAGSALEPGEIVEARLDYVGLRAETRGATRDVALAADFAGPAAPTAACFPRTWDPMEDALALGWPKLPVRLVAVDQRWTGLRVEGKCNRSACVYPVTGGGGPDNHHRACVTMDWAERLAGVYDGAGGRWALVASEWSDGHGDAGIRSERLTLVSVDHGRPAWSRTTVHHAFNQPIAGGGFAPVERTWTLESIDACAGSLASLGWQRPQDVLDDLASETARFAETDALRRTDRRREQEAGAD